MVKTMIQVCLDLMGHVAFPVIVGEKIGIGPVLFSQQGVGRQGQRIGRQVIDRKIGQKGQRLANVPQGLSGQTRHQVSRDVGDTRLMGCLDRESRVSR